MSSIQVIITDERLTKLAKITDRAYEDSAGMDLRAMFEGDGPLILPPGKAALIPTGLKVWIRDPNFVGLLFPRSGTGHKRGLVLGNGTGVIDAAYQGDLMVSLLNRTDHNVDVELGERIAQLVITPVMRPHLEFVEEFGDVTARGTGGFGSSGTK